jgi:hypothetical protein
LTSVIPVDQNWWVLIKRHFVVIPLNQSQFCVVFSLSSLHLFFCKSLSSISFKSRSELRRIDCNVFHASPLRWIIIPLYIKVLDGSVSILDSPKGKFIL